MIKTVEENVKDYHDLLQEFRLLPIAKNIRTYMEVSGYPHYENVCSNILGFYFDPEAEHGLKDLFIKAFLQMAGGEKVSPQGNVSVMREHTTSTGNRIDLLVDGEFFTIGIENKIFHGLKNDLLDYEKTIDCFGRGKKIVVKAVLGLKHIQGKLDGNFISYTYDQFWGQVQKMLGHYVAQAEPKWLTYLIEFMNTTKNLAGENMELKKTDAFFIEHNKVIEDFISERNAFLRRLGERIIQLMELMKETEEVTFLDVPPYGCSTDRLVFDFKMKNNYDISFDLYLTPDGWDLQLFGRGAESYRYLLKLTEQSVLKTKMVDMVPLDGGKRYSVQKWVINDDLGEIRDSLCQWIKVINEADYRTQEY